MITLTINSATLTSKEAGAAASMLLALHPDCLADAIAALTDSDQLRLPLVTEHRAGELSVRREYSSPHTVAATPLSQADAEALERGTPEQTPTRTAAEAFGAAGAVAPEAGVPFANPGHAAAPPASPVPVAPVAAAPANSEGASTGPAAPVTAPVAGVELDASGLPWDARIHATGSDGKGVMTAKGVWRAKRGANQLTVHKIEAELRAALGAPAAGTVAPAPAPAPVETPAERTAREAVEQGLIAAPLPVAVAPVAATVAPPPPVPAPPVSPPAAGSPAPSPAADDATPPATLFANAMRKVTKAQLDGHITVPETDAILTHLGLAQMRDLIARPDLIPVFDESVDNHVARFVTQ